MKDRLGEHAWVNRFPGNPTQIRFRRFVRVPQTGLPDMLDDSKKAWEKFKDMALKTRLEEK
jgi:hypothetical protein